MSAQKLLYCYHRDRIKQRNTCTYSSFPIVFSSNFTPRWGTRCWSVWDRTHQGRWSEDSSLNKTINSLALLQIEKAHMMNPPISPPPTPQKTVVWPQSNEFTKGPPVLVQHFRLHKGGVQIGARALLDPKLILVYHSPIPVGRMGVIY